MGFLIVKIIFLKRRIVQYVMRIFFDVDAMPFPTGTLSFDKKRNKTWSIEKNTTQGSEYWALRRRSKFRVRGKAMSKNSCGQCCLRISSIGRNGIGNSARPCLSCLSVSGLFLRFLELVLGSRLMATWPRGPYLGVSFRFLSPGKGQARKAPQK